MSKGRILIIEDDRDIGEMLKHYFGYQGYDALHAIRGEEGLELCRRKMPNVVVLDIMLPDTDGYQVCKHLRSSLRTSHIPIIFLTQKDERSDKIAGLELGADDYITKPFDMQELGLRVQNALRRASYENLTNPTTGLPSGRLIEEHLRKLVRQRGWRMLYIGINHLQAFNEVYGFVAGADVLRFVAMILNESVELSGTPESFVGHADNDSFLLVSTPDSADKIEEAVLARFGSEIGSFYSFRDREAGYLSYADASGRETRAPLMTLSIGAISDGDGPFSDIRQVTEMAAEARRSASPMPSQA